MVSSTRKKPDRSTRLRKLLAPLHPLKHEVRSFELYLEAADDGRLDRWERGAYLDGDVLYDFKQHQQQFRAESLAPEGDGTRGVRPGSQDEAETARRWAASLADALMAADDDVVAWRTAWLAGETVPWADLEVTLKSLSAELWDPDAEPRWLRLITPGWNEVGAVWPRVRVDGSEALEALEALATELAGRWWWTLDQAVVFVVTGLPPLASTLRTRHHTSSWGRPRVVLTIDPAVPLDHVIQAYGTARRAYVPAGRPVEAATWEAAAWRLEHLDLSAPAAAREWLRRQGTPDPSGDAVKAWRRKVKAALSRLGFDPEEEMI